MIKLTETVSRINQVAKWLDEDNLFVELLNRLLSEKSTAPSTRMEIHPSVLTTESNPRYSRGASGFKARTLRYLYTGQVRSEELRSILGMSPRHFAKNIANLRRPGSSLVESTNGTISLTELGRSVAKYYVDNPKHLVKGKK